MKEARYAFRFEKLDIWKKAVEIAMELFNVADELDKRHLHRIAEQLRGPGLSMSNNIAEGSGSNSRSELYELCRMITGFIKSLRA